MVFDTGTDATPMRSSGCDGHGRLAHDRDARRPAADLPDLVPLGGRRGADLQRPAAKRNVNIAANPRVTLHLNDDGRGGDVVVIEGDARIDDASPPVVGHGAYPAKYGELDR